MYVNIALGVILGLLTFIDFETIADEAICNRCWPAGAFIGWSYVLMFVAILAALAGAVIGALMNPKAMKGTAIGLGAMLVIALVSYLLAGDEVLEAYKETSPTASKLSGAGLYMFYILFVLAILSIVYSAVSRALK